jgi:hypothetical protein
LLNFRHRATENIARFGEPTSHSHREVRSFELRGDVLL